MRTLIIGIDGADPRVFDYFQLPNLQALAKALTPIPVTEDLYSRGWAEMLTGLHGSETGACYEKPRLDGTFAFTQKCNRLDLEANPDHRPLWELLASREVRCGFLNVPTTMPAAEVNGFFVAGAGGGLGSLGSGYPKGFAYPESVSKTLIQRDYVPDIRFRASGIRDWKTLFQKLEHMLQRRTETFIGLQNQFDVDFGFIAYMATSRLQNLAMADIENVMSGIGSKVEPSIRKLYQTLDTQIGRLLDKLSPGKIIVAGDHGAVPMKFHCNLNRLLQEGGFQKPSRAMLRLAENIEPFLPLSNRAAFRRRTHRRWGPLGSTDTSGLKAFGHRYVPGVFLNDQRFTNQVGSNKNLTEEICDFLNQHPVLKENQISARPYRRDFMKAANQACLPDVWIDKPDSVFCVSDGPAFTSNPFHGPIDDLSKVSHDLYSGTKGRHPVCWASSGMVSEPEAHRQHDLRIVYELAMQSVT